MKYLIIFSLTFLSCSNKMDRFIIERSNLTTLEGKLFLKGEGKFAGHCHLLPSVKDLLESEIFRKSNPSLIPVFEKAKTMMEQDKEGIVK